MGRKFAYGAYHYGGKTCPITATNSPRDIPPEYDTVMAHYDSILEDRPRKMQGVVDEETAKQAWKKATERLREFHLPESKYLKAAEQVADDLGWDV